MGRDAGEGEKKKKIMDSLRRITIKITNLAGDKYQETRYVEKHWRQRLLAWHDDDDDDPYKAVLYHFSETW